MWPTILIIFAVVVIALIAFIASRPSQYRVERSTTISASPDVVFAQVNDLRKWEAWSPWARKDPNAKMTYEGPAEGARSVMSWDGNKEVGAGRMTILDSKPNESVRIKLEFFKPFAGLATANFSFQPQADGTKVSWSMLGESNFLGKAICLVMDMDKMIGGDFEKGLAGMKAVSESAVVLK